MSYSDWDADSDYRQFNPGKYAMRQLGRSVSRRTKKLLLPRSNRRDSQSAQDDNSAATELEYTSPTVTGINSAARNGYLIYDFDDSNQGKRKNRNSTAGKLLYRRGPPLPSGIHRRSVSFDNLPIMPSSIPRRSTEPPSASPNPVPQHIRLPEASTWNSGSVKTKSAILKTNNAAAMQLSREYDAVRRKWLPELAHYPQSPKLDTNANGLEQDLATRPQEQNDGSGNKRNAQPSGIGPDGQANRESFSGPAQLDASANFSESQNSIINTSDPFENRHMWLNEEEVNPALQKNPEILVAMAEIAAAAAAAAAAAETNSNNNHKGVTFIAQNGLRSQMQRRDSGRAGRKSTGSPEILPSVPVASGLFRKQSERSQNQVSRESSQRRLGNIARVIGHISKRLNRIRSHRSSSQPATPAEVRQSIFESAYQNMLQPPAENGHDFYRFVVNPADPVSDEESVVPDSPTISYHPSTMRSRHRRSSSLPSQNVDNTGTYEAYIEPGVKANKEAKSSNGISNMHNTTTVNVNVLNSHDMHPDIIQHESVSVPVAAYHSKTHNGMIYTGAFHSGSSHRRTSSDSAWLHQAQTRAAPFMTNQGHDGSLSALVQAKLDTKFTDGVHVSTRLNSDSSTESSYGTFVRFHNSGELNGIFAVGSEPRLPAKDNVNHEQSSDPTATNSDPIIEEQMLDSTEQVQQVRRPSLEYSRQQQPQLDEVSENAYGLADITTQKWPRAPRQSGAVFISNRYARNQENIRQFVEEVRAARQDSERRKRDAELRRQIVNNDQAVLDAAIYIYERQQRDEAFNKHRIEQVQQILEGRQLQFVKERLSEKMRLQQQQGQQQRQGQQVDGVQSHNSSISTNAGGGCAPPVISGMLPGRHRLKHRRKSEGSGNREAVVKPEGRRRATMLGMFCIPSESTPPSASTANVRPQRLIRKDTEGYPTAQEQARKASKVLQMQQVLDDEPEQTADQAAVLSRSKDQRPLRKSRSFSHFGSSESIGPLGIQGLQEHTRDPWIQSEVPPSSEHRQPCIEDDRPKSGQATGIISSKDQRLSKTGALLGVLGKFGGNHARRKSNAYSDAASKETKPVSSVQGGGWRKMAFSRGQRRRTLGESEDNAKGDDNTPLGLSPSSAQQPAPNIQVHVPRESLSDEICNRIAQSAAENGQSSSRRRMYSQMLVSLRSPDANLARELLQEQLLDGRRAEVDTWRDSAITGLLTQVSAGTSSKHKSATAGGIGASAVPTMAEADTPEHDDDNGDGEGDEYGEMLQQESGGAGSESSDDQYVLKPNQYKHVVRFEELPAPKTRMSSVAMNTITARNQGSDIYERKAKRKDKTMARSMPHSHAASRVVSSNGSFTDMIMSGSSDIYRYRLADLPGLDGFDTPSSNGAMLTPVLDAPLPLPANERLRRLETEVLYGGSRTHPGTIGPDGANQARTTLDLSFDSPISDAGTGKTQILDFTEANIHTGAEADVGAKCRRPSARPEIRDVRGIIWDDTNPTPTAADSTEMAGAEYTTKSNRPLIATSDTKGALQTNGAAADTGATETPATLNNVDKSGAAGDSMPQIVDLSLPKYATVSALDYASLQLLRLRGDSEKALAQLNCDSNAKEFIESPPIESNPLTLARLVQTSPDPRNLIYDASSQFGTMRSPKSPGLVLPDAKNVDKPAAALEKCLPFDMVARIAKHKDEIATQRAQSPGRLANSTDHPPIAKSKSAPAKILPKQTPLDVPPRMLLEHDKEGVNSRSSLGLIASNSDGHSIQRGSDQVATAAESEAVARASNQATMSLDPLAAASAAVNCSSIEQSPKLRKQTQVKADTQGDTSGKRGDRPLSLQEYVQQQKTSPKSRSSQVGHEQLNFRVSLLERPQPEFSRKSRSVSLPSPQSALPMLSNDMRYQAEGAHQLADQAINIPRPFAHQRTRSFYDSPPLVQALLQPDISLAPKGATHAQSQGADEEIAERALFSQLLGDGAALTSPDVKLARRQSTASSLVPASQPLFDPTRDTGENGVPDSVLRAYLAGDLTAVERFFEHIMLITAPSSIYDGEVSEDGDWTFGLEGPPPEIVAQRKAAKELLLNMSREVPDMIDTSAADSHVVSSGYNLQGISLDNSPVSPGAAVNFGSAPVVANMDVGAAEASTSSEGMANEGKVNQPDIAAAITIHSKLDSDTASSLKGSRNAFISQKTALQETQPAFEAGYARLPPRDLEANTDKPGRRIAIPRSKLSHAHRSRKNSQSGNASGNITHTPPLQGSDIEASAEPFGHWEDPSKLTSVDFTRENLDDAVEQTVAHLVAENTPVSHAENAKCLSPGRQPTHNYNRNRGQTESGQRKPIPESRAGTKKQEKQLLLARLRILEGMIQKTAIEESRLQPPPALRRSQLVEDMQSMASIYSSSMELDYDRIHNELSRSIRQSADVRQHVTNAHAPARPSCLSKPDNAPVDTLHDMRQQPNQQLQLDGMASDANYRADVLKRLKRGSQARTRSHLRTSVLNRQTFASPRNSTDKIASEAAYSKKWRGKPIEGIRHQYQLHYQQQQHQMISVVSSSGSIRIEIVDESSLVGSHITDSSSIHLAPSLSSTGRFRRTAKLLSS
ncbi:hypothetical protein BX070DRAFT_255174 [Coemansia spiralis]|nr:hypothetical protein BX070DRAFT_255174 [Coemansia spiralis]